MLHFNEHVSPCRRCFTHHPIVWAKKSPCQCPTEVVQWRVALSYMYEMCRLHFFLSVEEQHGKWGIEECQLGVSSSASVRRNGQNKETEESFFCLLATNLLLRGGKKPLKYQMYSVWLPQSLHLVFSCKLNWLNFNLDCSYKKMSKIYCYES